ncbi:MAG: hypothetical protein ABI824_01390 [Acidobacteriota bacterium]
MKTLEFKGSVTANGQIRVPSQIAEQIPKGETVQIVLAWGSPNVEDAWKALGRQGFEAAYASEDSVYELLDQ